MICAGKGARVIANIWNGSLDKRNICTMLREKQTEEQKSKSVGKLEKERKEREKERQSRRGRVSHCALWYVMSLNVHATGLTRDIS